MASLTDLLRKWRDDLAGWAIPEHITVRRDRVPLGAAPGRVRAPR